MTQRGRTWRQEAAQPPPDPPSPARGAHTPCGVGAREELGELGTGHPAHNHVREEHVDGTHVGLADLQAISAVRRFNDRMALAPQDLGDAGAHGLIVLDEQHGA